MLAIIIIESFLLVLYICYVIYSYSAKDVPFYVKLLALLSWLLSFSLIIILPLEIYFVIKYY
jgi:hypothetical protein